MINISIIIAEANFIQFDLWRLHSHERISELEYVVIEKRLQAIRDEARKCNCHLHEKTMSP